MTSFTVTSHQVIEKIDDGESNDKLACGYLLLFYKVKKIYNLIRLMNSGYHQNEGTLGLPTFGISFAILNLW